MNNDLISRSELKKACAEVVKSSNNSDFIPCPTWNDAMDLIDNAPTVTQDCSDCKRFDFPYFEVKFDKEQMQELVDKAKAEVLASIERPQGEWKAFVYDYDMPENEHGDHIRPPKEGEEQHWEEYWAPEYYCSICGAKNHKANFCPNCGADMRSKL